MGLAALALACATSPEPPAEQSLVLDEVSVEAGDGATFVALRGAGAAQYESFLHEDPARIVVDLRSVAVGNVAESVAVYDGTVEEVTVTGFEDAMGTPQARVELALRAGTEYQIEADGDVLEIRVASLPESEMAEGDAWTGAAAMDEAAEATAMETGEQADETAAAPMAPATVLTGVVRETAGEGTVLLLSADGALESFEHFTLENPSRLVIDLPGIQSKASSRVDVGTDQVARVRVGQHEDKVRVVVDAADGTTLGEPSMAPAWNGLLLALGGAALPASEAPPAAMAAGDAEETSGRDAATWVSEGGWTVVRGVRFEPGPERDRIVVEGSGELSHTSMQPDAETLVLMLPGTELAPEAGVRIAPDPVKGISLVTAFQQPDVARPEVRVVVRRAEGLQPVITREGNELWLDFPAGGHVAAGVPMAAVADTGIAPAETTIAVARGEGEQSAPASIQDGEGIGILAEGGLSDGKKYVGRRISLDFKDVDISDVLRLIAEVSELNIIAGDEVKGEVTIRLVEVPWDQALDVILLTKGLGFVRVGNVLRIAPSDTLKAENEARLQERRAKEKLEDLLVKLQPVNYADVKEVSKMVNRLLTARGTVDVDARTNTLIIKDIATVIDEATALVKAIDTQTPQVLIESKIVEAALDFSRELGSTWAFGTQPLVDGFDESSGDRRDLGGNDFALHDNSLLGGFTDTFNHVSVSNPITSVANGLLDVGAFLLDEKLNLELRIEAAESNGEGKVISSPRVVTLDNRTATIEQGVSIPFQTFENGDAKLEFIDAVLKLEVTPHITADRSIIMKILVERNAPDDSVPTPTGSPAIAKNEAETETLVKDGQTLVIGGIYTVQKSERSSQVPYFGDIPILGVMFRNNEVTDNRKELLIFVTPKIVQNTPVAS